MSKIKVLALGVRLSLDMLFQSVAITAKHLEPRLLTKESETNDTGKESDEYCNEDKEVWPFAKRSIQSQPLPNIAPLRNVCER